jgi:hypothetical protein
MGSGRSVSGSVVRGIVDWVVSSGLRDKVFPTLPPGAQRHFQHAPLPIAWIDPSDYDPLFPAIAKAAGPEILVRCGVETTRTSFGPIVQPILKGMLKIFGGGPDAIFSHMDSVTRVLFKGLTFDWVAHGPEAGTLTLSAEDRPPAEWFRSWVGALQFAFELTNTEGKPIGFQVAANGKSAKYELAWSAKGKSAGG